MIGKTVGHYRILEQLGKGGMGEVYLADDTTLDRKVALKFLPEAFTSDPERMARFEREAKLLASLNHPNIAGIYGLEQAGGNRFLVLEYVEGETLKTRLSKGALPLEDALPICRQIAEGLEAAHEKGVIHRDLKPANVMITAEEKVKILDFGLAKALADETQSVDPADSPTITNAMTRPGVVLGTAAYMSPEQAKGKSVDKRADIWAFGCILYECLTGKRAFEGETVTEALAAILRGEPDWNELPSDTPQNIRFVLRKCLEKDMGGRFRDAADLRILMLESLEIGKVSIPVIKQRPWLAWSVASICLIGVLVLGALYFLQASVEAPETRLEVITPPTSELTSFAISPDGRYLTFVASAERQDMLWLRPLNSVTTQLLPGTEGARLPFWSPDSRSIGFFADGKLKRIDIDGGLLLELASAPYGQGGTWNRDGVIVFARSRPSPLYCVPESGGDSVAITKLDSINPFSHCFPQFLPDGRHLLFLVQGNDLAIHLASLDSTETRPVLPAESSAVFAPPGQLLFMRQGTLFSQNFDEIRCQLLGEPIRIADSIALEPDFKTGVFSVSQTGILAYRRGGGSADRRRLAWFDRSGNEVGTVWGPDENDLFNPELSPTGRWVAVSRTVKEDTDVWLIDTAHGLPERLTFNTASDGFPVWSPDESRVAFYSNREDSDNLYQKASSGVGNDELLSISSMSAAPNDWSPDGRSLLFMQLDPKGELSDLGVLQLFGERKPAPFVTTPHDQALGQFSPDGRWVAYNSNESGRYEVYVQSFPDPRGKWQISTDGGMYPRWYPDGKELFYISPDSKLMAVPIESSGQMIEKGAPEVLFRTRIVGGGNVGFGRRQQYDVSPDGKHFLINIRVEESVPSPITVVINWTRSLEN